MRGSDQSLDLEAFLPYMLSVLASRVSSEFAAIYAARFGISIPEWRVVAHLARNREVSVREVRRRVDMDKSKVSRAAARLEEAGLIAKQVNATDRRLVRLSLTRKGRRLYEQIGPLALDYERRFLSTLTPAEAATFRGLMERLLAQTEPLPPIDEEIDA
jgi:DNA-binding MarR family transcriptional regulator